LPWEVFSIERCPGSQTERGAFAFGSTWVFGHPTVVETKFVGPQWSFDNAVQGVPDLKGRSEPVTCPRLVCFPDLPSPEEGIYESIHASQRETEQPILGSLIPTLPVIPGRAIRVCSRGRLGAYQVEATVIEAITVFSSDSDTKSGLAWKKIVNFLVMKRETGDGVHGIQIVRPGRASPSWPNTSHLTIRRRDIDGIVVSRTTEREVGVCIDSDSIDVGELTSPSGKAAEAVVNQNVWTLALADACDFTNHPVNFQVASRGVC